MRTGSVDFMKRLKRKKSIISILARATGDGEFWAERADGSVNGLSGYYTLTEEEVVALVNGDMKKIEGWLGKLDMEHATWLWCQLNQ